jgi:excisionase family DNA binding protein
MHDDVIRALKAAAAACVEAAARIIQLEAEVRALQAQTTAPKPPPAPPPAPIEGPAYLTLNSAAKEVSLSRSTLYRMINQGQIIARKVGKRTLIEAKSLQQAVNGSGNRT